MKKILFWIFLFATPPVFSKLVNVWVKPNPQPGMSPLESLRNEVKQLQEKVNSLSKPVQNNSNVTIQQIRMSEKEAKEMLNEARRERLYAPNIYRNPSNSGYFKAEHQENDWADPYNPITLAKRRNYYERTRQLTKYSPLYGFMETP